MSGRQRMPAGEPRKASQRRARRAIPSQVYVSRVWRLGEKVRWRDRIGVIQRDLGDGEHAEIMISESASCRPCLSSLLALGIAPI